MRQEISTPPPCEVVILTALPLEFQAVLGFIENPQEIVHPTGTIYYVGSFAGERRKWNVAVAQIGMGGTPAAIAAEKAISFFPVQIALFVGIAGGRKDVQVGDVVVANKIYAYESGKAGQRFEPRPELWRTSYALEQRARSEASKDTWLTRLGNDQPIPPPRVYVGPLAAGAQVVASTQGTSATLVSSTYGDALAVEMEGQGFLQAVHINRSIHSLIIRGIADRIDNKASADAVEWQGIAARYAAAFAFQVLAKFTLPELDSASLYSSRRPAIWNVPFARNPFFTGRETLLAQLHTQLQTTQTVALSQPQAISGLGGVGKTQLAIEYAYRYGQEYQAVLWARAETTETLNTSYTEIARLLQLPQKDAQEQEVIVQAVKSWLSSQRDWLLILDNADELAILVAFLPSRFSGHLLLTTRASAMGGLARRFEVKTMDEEAGALLLLRRASLVALNASLESNSSGDRLIAAQIAKELGGLPLALDLAGAYIEETGCGLAGYQRLYQTRQRELLRTRGGFLDDYPEPVTATWSLAFERVERQNPVAANLLRFCAYLSPDAIPEEILTEEVEEPGGVLAPVVADAFLLGEAIEDLRAYSLLTRDPQTRTLAIHRLVQAIVRDGIPTEIQQQWMQRAVQVINAAFPKVEVTNWSICERLLPHALVCAVWIGQVPLATPSAARLLNRVGYYLYARARYAEAEPLYEQALAIREQPLGAEHPDTVSSLNNLAGLYQAQGRYTEAEPLLKRALLIREQVLGATHPDTAQSLNNLALLYMDQGEYARAEPLLQRALSIQERALGATHSDTAQSLNNLALLYLNQGKYAQAEPLLQRALSIREQALGATHPDTAQSLDNLALLYLNQEKYAEAEPLLQRALSIREQALGAAHPYTAQSLNNLALLYLNQEKYAKAEPLLQRTLSIQEQVLGSEHPNTANYLDNLANLYYNQGKYEEAEPLYQRALTIREQTLGSDHLNTVTSLDNLANLYYYTGRYELAEPLYQRVLESQERVLGSEHYDTVFALNKLAMLYYTQGMAKEAEPLLQRILTISEDAARSQYLDKATILNSLGLLSSKQGSYEQAKHLLEQALELRENSLGPEHPDTATSLNSLALLYFAQNEDEQARPLYQHALAIYKDALSAKHPSMMPSFKVFDEKSFDLEFNYFDTTINLNDLGLLLQEKGDVATARSFFDLILTILKSSPACHHPNNTDQQLAIQEVLDWLEKIIQDMDIAQISRSKFSRTSALNRAVGMLSETSQILGYFSIIGQLLIKRVTDHWREVVTREASRVGKLVIRKRVSSPYIFTPPVKGNALIGREDVFETITSLWAQQGQRNSLLIHGHRRMGKTSVAQALATRCNLGSDTQLVYLSLEGQAISHEGDLYQLLSFRFWLRLKDKLDKPNAEDFAGSNARFNFDFFLAQINEVLGDTRFVLVLDEFEMIYIRLGSKTADEVIAYLRAQTVTYTWLTLALVGLSDLDDLRLSYSSSLLGWEGIPISFLDAEQVKNILANPPQDPEFPLDYSPEALQTIAFLTHGQPYLVQVIGDRLVKHFNRIVFTEQREHKEVLDASDVQAVIADPGFYATAAAYFDGVWGQATRGRPGEVVLLKALAEHEEGLKETALKALINLDDEAFIQSLQALVHHDVVCNKDNHISYAVPLMRRWVQDTLCRPSSTN